MLATTSEVAAKDPARDSPGTPDCSGKSRAAAMTECSGHSIQQVPASEEFTAKEREKARNLKDRKIKWLSGCSKFRVLSRLRPRSHTFLGSRFEKAAALSPSRLLYDW
jgi:hypothetical protein